VLPRPEPNGSDWWRDGSRRRDRYQAPATGMRTQEARTATAAAAGAAAAADLAGTEAQLEAGSPADPGAAAAT
jgi:hypothetical protein